MRKQDIRIAAWVLCATLLGGCAEKWPDALSVQGLFDAPQTGAETVDADSFSGSLAAALAERGIDTTITQPLARPAPRPALMPIADTAPPTAPALPPQRAQHPQPRPLQRQRIVSIPLSVADDAHAQGLLRRAALLRATHGGRIRLAPYGPDPERAAAIARAAAARLLFYGVPEQQLAIDRAVPVNVREARIDVLFEH